MSHFSRLPVRFIESNNDLLKSQTEEVAVGPMPLLLKGAALVRPNERSFDLDALAKSEALSGGHADAGTDDMVNETVPVEEMRAQFRAPRDRNLGNVLFRRNIDSQLDYNAAKHVVVDAIHRACDSAGVEGLLNDLDKMVLSVFFPGVYMYVDPGLLACMAAVHMRLAPHELDAIRALVASHLKQEMGYNAGLGGFPAEHPRS